MVLGEGGWTISRRIGVGDRELVRAGLLQIGLMRVEKTEEQVKACLAAARALGKTLRIYVNTARLPTEEVHHLIQHTMGQARDHDFMEENVISRNRFNWVLDRCDIIVESVGEDPKVLTQLVQRCWLESKGRHILGEVTWRKTLAEVKNSHPEFFARDDDLWQLWLDMRYGR